jgi:lysine 6-dehydrogenase
MKIAVLGAGQMGTAAVYDLARADGVTSVLVCDMDLDRAEHIAANYGAGKATALQLDLSDVDAVTEALRGCSSALAAASYRLNEGLTRACIAAGTHLCDLGGNNDVVRAQFDLSAQAEAAGVGIVPDCGLAPGMVSVLAMRVLELMPDAETVRLRVGGLPLEPEPPWNYQVVFSVEGLINEYLEPAAVLRDGQIVEVPSLAELEELDFPEPFGRLEAFTTSGGASTLPWTLKGRVRNLDYKTIRYPGHGERMAAVFALGLAGEEPRTVDGVVVKPRRLLERLIDEVLGGDGPDCVLTLVEAEGPSGKVGLRLIDRLDPETGLTAMMRCTAFPAAVTVHMLATGAIEQRGTLHQEDVVPPAPYIDALRARGLDLVQL